MDRVETDSQAAQPTDLIIYPRLKTLIGLIDATRRQFEESGSPKGRVLTGPVGVGKHTLVNYYKRLVITQEFQDEPDLPVLHFSVPVPCTPEALLYTMLSSLGRPSSFTYKPPQLADLVIKWLEKRRTKFVIVENFQDILSSRRTTQLETTKQYLSTVLKAAEIPALFVYPTIEPGRLYRLKDVLIQLNATETVLQPFALAKDNPGSIEEFALVVQALEEQLAVTLPWTEKNRNKLLARIYFATGGVMSSLTTLLRVSAYRIRAETTGQISLELLSSIFTEHLPLGRQGEANPFLPEWRRPKNL